MSVLNYDVGDTIEYRTYDGTLRVIVVGEIDSDIKNGRPGFQSEDDERGYGFWGYDEQITRVVSRGDTSHPPVVLGRE